MKKRRVTLYVKSVKTLVGEDERGGWGFVVQSRNVGNIPVQPGVYPDLKTYKEAEYKDVLPEEQKAVVELVKSTAEEFGFDLEVVDANKENIVKKLQDKIRHVDTFPTLISSTGERIEGEITEDKIRALLTRLSSTRPI